MEYQQFTPYDPYEQHQHYHQQQHQHHPGQVSPHSPVTALPLSQSQQQQQQPGAGPSGAHQYAMPPYAQQNSFHSLQQHQQQPHDQHHHHPSSSYQPSASSSSSMPQSRESASGPAPRQQSHRRDYSTSNGHSANGGGAGGASVGGGGGGQGTSAAGSSTTGSTSRGGPYARPVDGQLGAREGTVKASSTTSEFTKRKNWSQHIIDEIQDFMHVLGPDGTILFAAPSVRELTGWTVEEVTGRPLRDLIHADDVDAFLQDFNSSLTKGHELNVYYRFRMKDERYTILEVAGHPYFSTKEDTGERVVKCFFGMGRPYPSKNTAMLDSFLELKMENERLRQELQVMYREIEGGSPFSPQAFGGQPYGGSPFNGVDSLGHSPPSYDPRAANGGSVIDPKTGLVHANGLIPSSSNTYGALGIGISATGTKGDGTGDKKKKKQRVEDGDFVCRDCGTVDSPEWRKGPEGPKSLCNACGLRYAKLRSKDKLKTDVTAKP